MIVRRCFSKSAGLASVLETRSKTTQFWPTVTGVPDLSNLQLECGGELFATADAGDGPAAREFLRRFGVKTQGFCGGGELFALLNALVEFVGFGFGQFISFLLFEVGGNLFTHFIKRAWVGREDFLQL